MSQTNFKTDTTIKLPLSFIIFALVTFVTSQVILLISSNALTSGQFRIPEIWMSTHFLLLGFALMVAMGAMYQLVPVTFLTPIWNQSFGIIQFIVTATGIALFSILLGLKPHLAIYGGVLAIIGIIMFIVQMVNTMGNQEKKNVIYYLVIVAISCLFLTIIAGFLLGWNIAFGGILNHSKILYSHIVLGVSGWFTLLIFGFSYKLVPMFSLSHGFTMKWAKPAFSTYIVGLIVLIASFWIKVSFVGNIGWLLLFLGFTFFVLDIKEILAKRVRIKLDNALSFSVFAIVIGWTTHLCALTLSFFPNADFWGWIIYLYLMGWIIFSIIGYLYKIVPFLWWTHKYSEVIGKEKVPTMKDMIDEKLGKVLFILFTIGVFGLVISALVHFGIGVFLFQGLLVIAAIRYAISIVRILFI